MNTSVTTVVQYVKISSLILIIVTNKKNVRISTIIANSPGVICMKCVSVTMLILVR